MLFKL
jgi:hypothetical protein